MRCRPSMVCQPSGPRGGGGGRAGFSSCRAWVHGSAVGKKGIWFSVSRLSISLHLWRNVGHCQSQLACPSSWHDTQQRLSLLIHSDVWCRPAHVPHVLNGCWQSYDKCPQPWHLRQRVGSFLHFSA